LHPTFFAGASTASVFFGCYSFCVAIQQAGVDEILTANSVTGEFNKIDVVSKTNLTEVNIYAKNGSEIAFLPFISRESINIVTNESLSTNIYQLLGPNASTLTAFYEISFSGANTRDLISMSGSTTSSKAQPASSLISLWRKCSSSTNHYRTSIRPRLRAPAQENRLSRSNWYRSPHRKTGGASGRTVGSADFPGTAATFSGPSEGHHGAIINVILQAQWTPRFSTYVGYQGELGRNRYNANAVTGRFSFTFKLNKATARKSHHFLRGVGDNRIYSYYEKSWLPAKAEVPNWAHASKKNHSFAFS
jgi:hypothetical protein